MANVPRAYTLDQFNARAQGIWEEGVTANFVNFVLRGVSNGEQAVLDPIQNALGIVDLDMERIRKRRDYDSLIGLSPNIEVDRSIWVYPRGNPRDALTESIHLHYACDSGRENVRFSSLDDNIPKLTLVEQAEFVDIHKIPNLMFAKWDERNMIRVVFPSLATPTRDKLYLSKEEQIEFYEKGLRPAVQEITPRDAAEWPATWEDEVTRARRTNGTHSFQTKQVARGNVRLLGVTLRRCLEENGVNWAKGFIFLHNVRGTKHGTPHDMSGEDPQVALAAYLTELCLPMDASEGENGDYGQWYIDVGLEIFYDMEDSLFEEEEPCLQWRTDSHAGMVREVLGINDAHATRITSLGSSAYSRDLVSHLVSISGCRINPGVQAQGDYEVCYFQLYTTDKSVTYNPEASHHGKSFSCTSAMTKGNTHCQSMYDIYLHAIDKNSSHARMEVRVPLHHAKTVLTWMNNVVLEESLVAFNPSSWWSFRAWRLLAIDRVLQAQNDSPGTHRVQPRALLLTATCVWLANGLHARPDDGSAARSLMHASLPHITLTGEVDRNLLAYPTRRRRGNTGDDEDEPYDDDDLYDDATHPAVRFGVVFLREISFQAAPKPPIFRMAHPILSENAFHHFFGADIEAVKRKYGFTMFYSRADIPPDRVSNKTRMMASYLEPAQPLFSLDAQGYSLPPPIVNDAPEEEEEGEEEGEQAEPESLDVMVSNVWRLWLKDVFKKCPNPKGRPYSYCKLTEIERSAATEEYFNNRTVSDVFKKCYYKVRTPRDEDLAFNHAFPAKGQHVGAIIQGYNQTAYRVRWLTLMSDSDEETASAIRKAVKKKYRSLFWIPHSVQDKLWPSSSNPSGFTRCHEEPGPAPRILTKAVPLWEEDMVI
ncbi:hypothetical protein Hypma_008348 [Hypsizygus marmoreus]|uniref:Uncharacterized protein n=1 Tax=Hypsizygus marmoreus TaxID=39966 RepID=A0A369JVI3_HYPMA|nr:hypothetical protein Hypma_008348 [Hypsizygus marmoreus]